MPAGGKQRFYCNLCPVSCGRKTDIRIHLEKLHTAEAPLKCKVCGKLFPDRYSHKVHWKTHKGEKCWKCKLCPYAGSAERHLESHMLIHMNQKPYVCDHCDEAFRQKQLLKRHVDIYHNPQYIPSPPKEKTHTCPECKKAFLHKGNLVRHMTLHNPDSELQERQMALKLGRQRKLHIIKVEVNSDDEDYGKEETEESEGEEEGGNQYVVLQMIQVESEDGTQQNVAVVPASSLMNMGVTSVMGDTEETIKQNDEKEFMDEETHIEEIHELPEYEEEEEDEEIGDEHIIIKYKSIEEADTESCFDFDEESEEEE